MEFLEEGDDDAIDALIQQEKAEKFLFHGIHPCVPPACRIRLGRVERNSAVMERHQARPEVGGIQTRTHDATHVQSREAYYLHRVF